MNTGTQNAVSTAMSTGKQFSRQAISTMAATNSAIAVASGFNPNDHSSLINALRCEMGPPTTKVHLPVPIEVNGKETSMVNTRALSNQFATHRQTNNWFDVQSSKLSKVPLHLYDDAYDPAVGAFCHKCK